MLHYEFPPVVVDPDITNAAGHLDVDSVGVVPERNYIDVLYVYAATEEKVQRPERRLPDVEALKPYVRAAVEKLGAANRTEAVSIALSRQPRMRCGSRRPSSCR